MSKVVLRGYLDVPAERLQSVRDALPEHVRLTRAEPACLIFDVTECPGRAGRFAVYEVFSGPAGFRAHQARAAASSWAGVTKGIPRHYTIDGIDG